MLFHAVKSHDGAVQSYRRAVEVAPETFQWRYYLATALADAGQRSGVLAIPEVNQLFGEILKPASADDLPAVADIAADADAPLGNLHELPQIG